MLLLVSRLSGLNDGNGIVTGYEAVGLVKKDNQGTLNDQAWYVAE